MQNSGTYENPPSGPVTIETMTDTAFSAGMKDSMNVAIDSSLLTPTDPSFRFWLVKPEEKIYIGDSRYPRDTTYLEHLSWKGLRMIPREKAYRNGDWLSGVLFLALILMSGVSAVYAKYISGLFQSLINYPTAFRMFREKNYSFMHGASRLEILFYIVFAVLVYHFLTFDTPGYSKFAWLLYVKTLAAVVFYFVLKKLAYQGLGLIFTDSAAISEFLFNLDNFNRVAGIILLPVVAVITYTSFESRAVPLIIGGVVSAGFYVMFLKRGISILLKKQFPIFYLFLYLCTLEFLPLLLIYKIVVD